MPPAKKKINSAMTSEIAGWDFWIFGEVSYKSVWIKPWVYPYMYRPTWQDYPSVGPNWEQLVKLAYSQPY